MSILPIPARIVNMIAAGEVVERPASVVKELVENSIDAGATDITISIREGGRAEIAVQDNGSGISYEDVPMAFVRHATSKLTSGDLSNFPHLGFRGEALAAIASVSKVEVDSFHQGKSTYASLERLKISSLKKGTLPVGTKITVKELFYATPVRLKFLKSSRVEAGFIRDLIHHLALSNPYTGFRLYDDGVLVVDASPSLVVSPDAGLTEATFDRAGLIFGRDYINNALRCTLQSEDYQLDGVISAPTWHRTRGDHIYISINGRIVKDRAISSTVKYAYRDTLARDKYPVVALAIQIPSFDVDVNVSPSKTEMRFRQMTIIRTLIKSAVNEALVRSGVGSNYIESARITPRTQPAALQTSSLALANADHPRSNWNRQPSDSSIETSRDRSQVREMSDAPTLPPTHASVKNLGFAQASASDADDSMQHRDLQIKPNNEGKELSQQLGIPVAQIARTYILAESDEGLVIIDQHAAHERIIYESVKQDLERNGVMKQTLLIPSIVTLSAEETQQVIEMKTLLETIGIDIERCDETKIAVRALPAILGKVEVDGLLLSLLQAAEEGRLTEHVQDSLWEICSSMACHGSIRAGRVLHQDEMTVLLQEMQETRFSGQCNHGRPTWICLRWHDIETLFGRK
ncbi:MAG: DNA mismatch repair endonuclease MutL [Alphaproteobacteria bacterium]|nr:DNA mismatch repair endonuclease MutL [Alphaproteobacteria bacterium]